MCRNGTPWRKDTMLRAFNGDFGRLRKRCSIVDGQLACGHAAYSAREFGGADPRAAAAYSHALGTVYGVR